MHYLLVFIALFLFSIFPGILLMPKLSGYMSNVNRCITIVFSSLSFWIILPWFVFAVHGNLYYASLFSLIFCAIIGIFYILKKIGKIQFTKRSLRHLKEFGALWLLLLFLLPLVNMLLPPGNDTAMHGYISRLIINNHGLPSNYLPLLPIQEFGSYSAGYQTLAAYFSFFDPKFLVEAINLSTVIVYVFFGLSLAALLSLFIKEQMAYLTAVFSMLISKVPQGSFGWGGNSTVLAFAFIFIAVFLFIMAYRKKSSGLYGLTAFPLAAIPLTHAIPAVGLFYMAPLLFILIFFLKSTNKLLLMRGMLITVSITIFFLLPFILLFDDPTNIELLERIKEWQKDYGPEHREFWWQDILETLKYIQYKLSDTLFFATLAVFVFLLFRQRFFVIRWNLILIVIIFLLIHNTHSWWLPFSHLLYPDRLVFFFLFPVAYLLGEFSQLKFINRKYWQLTRFVLLLYFITIAPIQFWKYYLKQNKINALFQSSLEAIEWLDKEISMEAQIEVTYGDVGIWIPTLINRATINTHVHFIHLGIFDKMKAMDVPHYYYITQKDRENNTEIFKKTTILNRVYKNEAIEIYK